MSERTWSETFRVEGGQLLDKVKQIVREGNVRRIRIKQDGQIVAEFPLTVGLVGAVFAPALAAIGAIAALATSCTLEIERVVQSEDAAAPADAAAPPAPESESEPVFTSPAPPDAPDPPHAAI